MRRSWYGKIGDGQSRGGQDQEEGCKAMARTIGGGGGGGGLSRRHKEEVREGLGQQEQRREPVSLL